MVPTQFGGIWIAALPGYSILIPDDDLSRASETLTFGEVWFSGVDGQVATRGGFKEKEAIKVGPGPDEGWPA